MKAIHELMQELLEQLRTAAYYGYASNLYLWNREATMPTCAVSDLSKLYGFLATKATEENAQPRLGEILAELQSRQIELDPMQIRIVRRLHAIYQRAKAVPLPLVRAWNETTSLAHHAWTEAKAQSDFQTFLPHLEAVLGLARERAQAFGYAECVYDALVPDFEPEMTTARLRQILLPLREPLSQLVRRLSEVQPVNTACLQGDFPPDRQIMAGLAALKNMGFDFRRGRLDAVAGHPMTITLGPNDVRMTTRVNATRFGPMFFATIHEGGHGLYQQGINPALDWVWLDSGVSMGIHESQSRLWENLVARGLPFWNFFWSVLQAVLPAFDQIEFRDFFRAINAVQPGLVRVEADEVTYNLHILLRFELELALLSGDLLPADLPGAWNDKMQEYLGVTPPNDAKGCLQDIHWSQGYFGYFPTYTLGNLMARQLWNSVEREVFNLEEDLAVGDFSELLGWLRRKVHDWGQVCTLQEMALEATGKNLSAEDWLGYIENKYTTLYDL